MFGPECSRHRPSAAKLRQRAALEALPIPQDHSNEDRNRTPKDRERVREVSARLKGLSLKEQAEWCASVLS